MTDIDKILFDTVIFNLCCTCKPGKERQLLREFFDDLLKLIDNHNKENEAI